MNGGARNGLAFELLLLDRMSDPYRESIRRGIGLGVDEAERIRKQCTLTPAEQLSGDLDLYSSWLGPPVKSETVAERVPAMYGDSVAHHFVTMLWPDLFWTVNRASNGSSWDVGFQNQARVKFDRFDPALVRPGVWSRRAIGDAAEHCELHDGWGEEVTDRFTFGGEIFEGDFVFSLLQTWRRMSRLKAH